MDNIEFKLKEENLKKRIEGEQNFVRELENDELVCITIPHFNQLDRLAELRDNEVISEKVLEKMQQSVLTDAQIVVALRLKRAAYRRLWAFEEKLMLDKWKHRDRLKELKRQRRAEVRAAKAARLAAKKAAKIAAPERIAPG